MYEYNWVYTIAQIDLMNIDAPMTCYKERKDKGNEPTAEELEETVKKWEERKKKRKWKMEYLFKKAFVERNNSTEAQTVKDNENGE